MKLEHFGMAEPGDCRLVFTADAEELERAITAEQAAPFWKAFRPCMSRSRRSTALRR